MRVILYGFGKMGKMVYEVSKLFPPIEIVCAIDPTATSIDLPIFKNLEEVEKGADAIIDFSNDLNLFPRLSYAKKHRLKTVIATTGFDEKNALLLKEFSADFPIFYSANFSKTLFLFTKIAKELKEFLPSFEVEIVETHHSQKLDSPSGTAKSIAKELENPTIHSLRGGTVVGEHEIRFLGKKEKITLVHSAESREIFALGALNATLFLEEKISGYYTMEDLYNKTASSGA